MSVGLNASAETDKACVVAAPFTLLSQADADKYRLADILAKSTSPYAVLTAEPANKDVANKNAENKNAADKPPRVHIVNFWAAWCAPCRKELPLLDKISADKIATVTLVNVGDKQEMAEEILAQLNIRHLKTRLTDDDILSTFQIAGLPASLLFNDKPQVYLGMGKLKDEQAIYDWLSCLSQFN
ncbi:MAG: hypothetical protein CSA44_00845 [Gammaproteobacteria bacterium]|nr:MAG: hypothetical protein CSA44_00845 [Gammaproteobacteria bacterium]